MSTETTVSPSPSAVPAPPRKFEQDIRALLEAIRIERREVIQRFVSGQTTLDETLSRLITLQHGYEAVREAQGDEGNIVFHAERAQRRIS